MNMRNILFLSLFATNAAHAMGMQPQRLTSSVLWRAEASNLINRLERVGKGLDYVDKAQRILYQIKDKKLLLFSMNDSSSKGHYTFPFALLAHGIALNQDGTIFIALKNPLSKVNQKESLRTMAAAVYNVNSKKWAYLLDDYFDSSAGIHLGIGFSGSYFIINYLISQTSWDLSQMEQ